MPPRIPLLSSGFLVFAAGKDAARLLPAELEARRRREVFEGILMNPIAQYDYDQALLLVETHNYHSGQLWLFEKLGMYPMVVQHFLEVCEAAPPPQSRMLYTLPFC